MAERGNCCCCWQVQYLNDCKSGGDDETVKVNYAFLNLEVQYTSFVVLILRGDTDVQNYRDDSWFVDVYYIEMVVLLSDADNIPWPYYL